jgi:DNA-binding transcriptional ArsR family regulator
MSDRSDVVASLDACTVRMVDRERVAAVQEMMPSDEDVEQAADVFALLGDPNRLRLLVALLTGGEMCVCDLAAVTGMSESAASHAVRWLRAHRIVSSPRRQGRMMYYRLEDAHVRMLLDLALTQAAMASTRSQPRTSMTSTTIPVRRASTNTATASPPAPTGV